MRTKFYVTPEEIKTATFETTGVVTAITAVSGKKHHLLSFCVDNNETEENNTARVRIADGFTDIYGSANAPILLSSRGGRYKINRRKLAPFFTLGTNRAFNIVSQDLKQIAGNVEYFTR